jgi:hypothetical protein
MTRVRRSKEIIHEGRYAAEVEIELHYSDESWSPTMSGDDARTPEGRPRRGREAWPSVRIDADRSKVRAAERRWAYAATPQRFAAWLINKFSLDALVQYRNGGGT